jgi:hypothetical protein
MHSTTTCVAQTLVFTAHSCVTFFESFAAEARFSKPTVWLNPLYSRLLDPSVITNWHIIAPRDVPDSIEQNYAS